MIKLNVLSTLNILLQALNHGLVLIKIDSVFKLSQNAWLNPHIVMNTDLRNKYDSKIWLWKIFFKLIKEAVLGKTMENVRKHRYQTCHNRKKKELFSIRGNLSYCKIFQRKFISNRNEKIWHTYE